MTAAEAAAETPDRHPIRVVLSEYARPYAGYFVGGSALSVLSRVPGRAPAVVLGVALDALLRGEGAYDLPLVPAHLEPTGTTEQFWVTVGLLVGAITLRFVLSWLGSLGTAYGATRTIHDVRPTTVS